MMTVSDQFLRNCCFFNILPLIIWTEMSAFQNDFPFLVFRILFSTDQTIRTRTREVFMTSYEILVPWNSSLLKKYNLSHMTVYMNMNFSKGPTC